jgi:DNA-binding NarL/FixJ family response regulator
MQSVRGDTAAQPHMQLSDRELQVLRMIAGGQSISDIAHELSLSPKTISTHKTRILEKLGMHNQAELIRYAIEHKLADVPPSEV